MIHWPFQWPSGAICKLRGHSLLLELDREPSGRPTTRLRWTCRRCCKALGEVELPPRLSFTHPGRRKDAAS